MRLLVRSLADVLSVPQEDPLTPEWVAVPTSGMQRWVRLELARALGATHAGGDGVAANISLPFPGELRKRVLKAAPRHVPGAEDPWEITRLVWAILEVLGDATLRQGAGVPPLAAGESDYGRARRIADLFDRYAMYRPDMILSWVDASSKRGESAVVVPQRMAWQRRLWGIVRDYLDEPSPPERLGPALAGVRSGSLELDLPPRIVFFGLTSVPGGRAFLDMMEAVATDRDVYCYFLQPSPAAAKLIDGYVRGQHLDWPVKRSQQSRGDDLRHPLLKSWGRPFREREMLLSHCEFGRGDSSLKTQLLYDEPAVAESPESLLSRLQRGLRDDDPPCGDFVLSVDDRSIVVHGCYGPARQVEVLRDAILHCLNDDPTLAEEDVVVLCPRLDKYAPYVEASFGAAPLSNGGGIIAAEMREDTISPHFSYRLVDRSLGDRNPMEESLEVLLRLVSGRCTSSQIIEFLSLQPVRRRFHLDDEDMETIEDWIVTTGVRWGLTSAHRVGFGFPGEFTVHTWQNAISSVLMSISTRDLETGLGPGSLAQLRIEANDVDLAGRFADFLARLNSITTEFSVSATPRMWCDRLLRACNSLFAPDEPENWQVRNLNRTFEKVANDATCRGRETTAELVLSEVQRVIAEHFRGGSGSAQFFRGGVTVTSMTPLRWIPFRVVCLLGFDESSPDEHSTSGDDLMSLAPRIGDPDRRAEMRQSLLEAVLSAEQQLILTYSAFDPQTNLPVPFAIEFLEFRDTIRSVLEPDSCRRWIETMETSHPRHSSDAKNFEPGAIFGSTSWSHDHIALAGARARLRRPLSPVPTFGEPLVDIDRGGKTFEIEELRSYLTHPVRAFLLRSLQIHRIFDREPLSDDLPVESTGRHRSILGRRLLSARALVEHNGEWQLLHDQWWESQRRLGMLPAGIASRWVIEEIDQEVQMLLDALAGLGIDFGGSPGGEQLMRLPLDGAEFPATLVAGEIAVGDFQRSDATRWNGTWNVAFARAKATDKLSSWLDVALLTLAHPGDMWTSVCVRRSTRPNANDGITEVTLRGETAAERGRQAQDALDVMLTCARLGFSEPLPLFSQISRKIHHDDVVESDWRGGSASAFTDGKDPDNQLVFGDISLQQLLDIPSRSSDPGSGKSRAVRLAHYLWGAYERTALERSKELTE